MPAAPVSTVPLALGADLGTGSARAFLFDRAGVRLGGVRSAYAWRVGTDGSVETDADALVDLVSRSVAGALAHAPPHARICAVGFSALWHTLLGVDRHGAAVTPAFAWNDTRARDAARALRARPDAGAVHERTGTVLHTSYSPARIQWLRETQPELAARVHRWLSVPEYVWLKLTGRAEVGVSIAAGSGLLNRHTLDWDEELLDVLGITRAQLSPVVPAESARHVEGRAAARWPLLREAVWCLPVGDGACANVGSGCTDETRLALSMGTSAALRVLTTRPRATPRDGLWSYPLDTERAVLGGAISNGGLVRTWLRATLRLPDDDAELDALLLARPPAAHGLTVLPFLAGERSPDWPLDITGAVHGLRAATSPLDLLQAGLEAVAYRLALVRDRITAAIPDTRSLVASGGALRSSGYWARLLADVFDQPVHVCADAETSSRGAALLALLAAGEHATLDALPAPETVVVEPDPAAAAAHASALDRHREAAAAASNP